MASFFFAILPCKIEESMKYKRVLLKLSGESLMGSQGYGIDPVQLDYYVDQIRDALHAGISVGIVLGGGNIYRGLQGAAQGMDRVQGDYMGMLATVINCMALHSRLVATGIPAVMLSGMVIDGITTRATRAQALKALQEGQVVLFAGGTGNPYFTTDTAAALRAAEMDAEVVLKGTRVDGVYTADPEKDPNAIRFDRLTFDEAIEGGYQILDITAFTLCRENNIPIVVFDINTPGNLQRVLEGSGVCTIIGV
jgi:uridylate kinase